jgi:hypothetical protein
MKQPLPPSIQSALAEVGAIADDLAMSFDADGMTESYGPAGTNITAVLDNLDSVAAAITWKELDQAPAMLQSAARAYRQTFPADSLGWEAAGRLTLIAYAIEKAALDNYMEKEAAVQKADQLAKEAAARAAALADEASEAAALAEELAARAAAARAAVK